MNITFLFSDYTFLIVATATMFLGAISGILGSFAMLRKQSLLGDGISHATLPGVVLAFLVTGSKSVSVLLMGALISGALAAFVILAVSKFTRIKFDSALAAIMSVFFGAGLVLLTLSQKIPGSNQAGLENFIFGQAATLLVSDVVTIVISAILIFAVVIAFWKQIKLYSFDPLFAKTLGYKTGFYEALLSIMLIVVIVLGIQSVGVILMSAMLIAPAVAARQWVGSLGAMVGLSALFGVVSGVSGVAISATMTGMPTGPVIVVCVSIITIISLMFAPGRGVVSRVIHRKVMKKELEANLKASAGFIKVAGVGSGFGTGGVAMGTNTLGASAYEGVGAKQGTSHGAGRGVSHGAGRGVSQGTSHGAGHATGLGE